MKFVCSRSPLRGEVAIPGSKSHTIRAVAIAGMAAGKSVLLEPLVSADTLSAARALAALGATVDMQPGRWCIDGCAGTPVLRGQAEIDVGNSGTTLNVVLGLAALLANDTPVTLTGDAQIQHRPSGALARALNDLGATVHAVHGNDCPPFIVRGPLTGGATTVEARSSQYVTSLLLACPLAPQPSIVTVPVLNEAPYVQITLDWLASQGVRIEHDGLHRFRIPGGQRYRPFERRIPADFSSATFFLAAGALNANRIACRGLDLGDSQPDKAVVSYLRDMGAAVSVDGDGITVEAQALHGIEIDMDHTPDALPMMAVVGCFASGETRLVNVAHARIKETDRIAVMCRELRKMGADIAERPDGLIIRRSDLHGTRVDGHGDHRVVMALAIAGMNCDGETTIDTAEAAGVTFPDFPDFVHTLGGTLHTRA